MITKFDMHSVSRFVCLSILVATGFLWPTVYASRDMTESELEANLAKGLPVMVLYYTSNCISCKKPLTLWNSIGSEMELYPGQRLIYGQMSCAVVGELCKREGIDRVPSVKLFINVGEEYPRVYTYEGELYDSNDLRHFAFEILFDMTHPPLTIPIPKKVRRHYNSEYDSSDNPEDEELNSEATLKSKSGKEKQHSLKPIDGLYEVTDDEYLSFFKTGEHFVNFYAPWCKHCQILEPVWTELAKSIPSDANVKISRVNCVKNEEACAAFEVKEYPLVAWISADKLVARYSGSRTLQKLKDFVRIQLLAIELGVHIIRLNQDIDETILRKLVKDKRRRIIALDDTNFNTFTQSGITFVHFTVPWSRHCLAVREQLRFLTAKITSEGYRVKVGVVDCSKNEDLCNENGIDGYPTFYLYNNGKRSSEEYTGERAFDPFLKYILQSSIEVY